MNALKELMALDLSQSRRLYPNVREELIPVRNYNDKTANGLTNCIITWINLSGGQAERISVTGRAIDKTKVVTDVCGFKKRIGSIQWIPPSMTKGSADISATIKGRSVKIEVKIKDRQSDDQKIYQSKIENAGGIYLLIRSFQDFYDWWCDFVK